MVARWTHNQADPGKVGWSVLTGPGKDWQAVDRPSGQGGQSQCRFVRGTPACLVSSLHHCMT